MTPSHCSSLVAAIAVLSMCYSVSSAGPGAGVVKKPDPCAASQGIKISGIQGCSLYRHYRDAIFDQDLPVTLQLPDDSERSWVIAALGLTMFSEARMENEHSLAAVAASILNRADYGKPGFAIDRVADAGANSNFSQWLVTSEIVAGKRVAWIEQDLKRQNRLTDENLAKERAANAKVLKDPIGYAQDYSKLGYPRILARSVELAQCIVDRAEKPDGAADLAWVQEFGTLFVDPAKIQEDKGPTGACHTHSSYMSATGLSYCPVPVKAQGVCSNQPAPRESTPCGGGEFSAVQHYQLASMHSEDDVKKLSQRIGVFLLACTSKSGN